MPPKKTLNDQLTFPLKSADKRSLRVLAAHHNRTLADMMRVIVGEYLEKPEVRVVLQSIHAESHAARLEPIVEG